MASSCSASRARRCARGNAASDFSWPLATCDKRLPSAWMIAQPVVPSPGSRPRILGKLLQLLVGHLLVAPDALDVVVLFQRIHQLEEELRIVAANFHLGRRAPGELRALAFAEQRLERLCDGVQVLDTGPDAVAVLVGPDVAPPRLDGRFQNLVGIARTRRIFDEAEPLEPMADAAAGAEIAAILGESSADVGRGAVAVVGQRLDDDRDSAGPESFVADLFVIL